jgi:hypothetical protein
MPSKVRSGKCLHLHAYRHRCATPTDFWSRGPTGFANNLEAFLGIADAIMKNADR